MEPILFLLLLFSIDRDPALRENLSSFLRFYRENRDLVGALAGAASSPSATGKTAETKSRPQTEVGDILEAYLERLS